jgi:hypothetical protein
MARCPNPAASAVSPAVAENIVRAGQSRFGQILVMLASAPLGETEDGFADDGSLCCFDWRTSA